MNSTELNVGSVTEYLRARVVVPRAATARAEELAGGVSGTALLVDAEGRRLVVKQALPRLRVDREWLSDPGRSGVEARALALARSLTPGAVPEVVDVDPDRHAFTMSAAPPGTENWRETLLAGEVDLAVAARTGEVLGQWHAATADEPGVAIAFDNRDWFRQLRVEPFYEVVAAARPALADAVTSYVTGMLDRRRTLVHGDYSPKNVLVLPSGSVWVVDFEVAHFGDPTFDVAFMLHHLMLKAVHVPQHATAFLACAATFLDGYRDLAPDDLVPDQQAVAHAGCLLLARVLGKSPARYLTAAGRRHAERHGARLVTKPPAELDEAWPWPEEAPR